MRPAQLVAELTTLRGYTEWFTPASYTGLVYFALVWAVGTTAAFCWLVVAQMRGGVVPGSVLRLTAATGSASGSLMYIPILQMLLSVYTCGMPAEGSLWAALGTSCFQGGHLALAIVVGIAAGAFATVATLFAVLEEDANPLSINADSKMNGRADAGLMLLRTLLVCVVQVFPAGVGATAAAAITLAAAIATAYIFARDMPYTHHRTNRIMMGAVAVFVWAAWTCLLVQVYPGFDGGVMVYAGAPFAVVAGTGIADWRARTLSQRTVRDATSATEVMLIVRYFLHSAVWGHPTEEVLTVAAKREAEAAMMSSHGGVTAASHTTASATGAGTGAGAGAATTGGAGGHAGGEEGDGGTTARHDTGGSEGGGLNAITAMKTRLGEELEGIDETEQRVMQVRAVMERATLLAAKAMLTEGIQHFKGTPMLHIFAAMFFSVYCKNPHMHMLHLQRAARHGPALDARYLIFHSRAAAEDVAATTTAMSAVKRMHFEKALAHAKRHVQVALARQVAFWREMADLKPDITRCHRILGELNKAMATAEADFNTLLELNGQSLLVLRLYAEFTMYIANDSGRAAVLLAEADRLEEQLAKDHERETGATIRIMEQSNLDVLADNTAVVTIGATHANLGIISDVNPYTTKLFGYSRFQMERRNISMLIPQPIADWHDELLLRFMDGGEGRVVDYTRAVFGYHKYVLCYRYCWLAMRARAGHTYPPPPLPLLPQDWLHLPHAAARARAARRRRHAVVHGHHAHPQHG